MIKKLYEKIRRKLEQKYENTPKWAKELWDYLISEIEKKKSDFIVNNSFSSIFIAWAPWAWKTEFVETVLNYSEYIIIDIDEYRWFFKWYNWLNAKEYQNSCSRVATKIFEYCLKNNLKFIFDWTISSEMWKVNISKVIKFNRIPIIILIYQSPFISYLYTKLREEKNERKVDQENFARIYYNSIKYCFEIKDNFSEINLIIVSKNKEREFKLHENIKTKEKFDKTFKIWYNIEDLYKWLSMLDDFKKALDKTWISQILKDEISKILKK